MTGISFVGPRDNETDDDINIRVAHTAIKGSGDQKGIAHLELILSALDEMDNLSSEQLYNSNGSRLTTLVYNLPESVFRDIELHRYDNVPWARHSFCAMDKFGVLGKLDGSYTGFLIDCFMKDIGLTRTSAFVQGSSEDQIRKSAAEIFGMRNSSGGNAYTEKSVGKRPFELGLGKIIADPFEPIVCQGELCFGGEGRPYGELVKELMESISRYPGFTPEKYLLSHRDFKIDLPERFSEDYGRTVIRDLKVRTASAYEEKLKGIAA